jgi:adenylate cyclase
MPAEQKVIRKLRAILRADVKGYSLLMADDEVSTIQKLKAYRLIMSNLINQHSGRVIDSPGDNLLAEFSSAVDAVECAVEIQKHLKKENDRSVKDKRLLFRIGVNIGDVVHDGDRIYGHGVNVAARIEGLADHGGIGVSRSAYDQVKGKVDLKFRYLGEHEVKNIEEPVRVYKVIANGQDSGRYVEKKWKLFKPKWLFAFLAAVIVIISGVSGGLYWKYFYLPSPSEIDPEDKMTFDLPKGPTIAVLPFDNMTGNPKQEFLSDGITET